MISFNHTSSPVFKDESLEIRKTHDRGRDFLTFTFKGKLTLYTCEEACYAIVGVKEVDPSTSYTHIWNCENMTGFDQKAKKRWMHTMDEMQRQIAEVWLISDKMLIRGAARLMSKFSEHQLKTFKSLDEAELWFTEQNSIDIEY